MKNFYLFYCLIIALLFASNVCFSQANVVPGAPITLSNAPQRDTSKKTNSNLWRDEIAQINLRSAYSQIKKYPDTGIHNFHRRPFVQPWYRNLGNHGSPVQNLFFTPLHQAGPTLGYHVFDVYRYIPDSLYYYNTTRPYTSFTFQLGSKLEQVAHILHTQNIKPNWNVAVQYRKTTSPGYYKIQRNNHDNGALTTNYQSKNLHYELYGAVVYNKEQHDENGGITSDSFLTDPLYNNRQTIDVFFQNDGYSSRRSSVTNNQRDFSFLLQHSYTLGRVDTLYNEDSTKYYLKLTPRFSVGHRLELSTEKYQYKDARPDSLRYLPLFTGHSFASADSVIMQQKWFWIDNRFLLNGFLGTPEKQLKFSAGIGNRYDKFDTYFGIGNNDFSTVSNYLIGNLKKEALASGEWHYDADAKFYFTGNAVGDFLLNALLGKDLGENIGDLSIGFKQQLSAPPYNYTIHETAYDTITTSFSKQNVTELFGAINSERFKLSAGINNYVIANYIYLDEHQRPAQFGSAFNLTQFWLNKIFRLGVFVLDNEFVFQQKTGSAPVNIPQLMGRHQLSIESHLFGKALKIATGAEIRYYSSYAANGYSPFFNRFYYQQSYQLKNIPEFSLFFNFKVKGFRAYIMGDQLQQFFSTNIITASGYPAQNAMLRFGFTWVMIN